MSDPASTPSARSPRALDIIGGLTTFVTMAYIVIVTPAILATPGTGIPFSGAATATVLVAASMTLLIGLYARLPFAVAPGDETFAAAPLPTGPTFERTSSLIM